MENKENQFVASKELLENDNNSAMLYERSRIKALSDQREGVQKRTFTKWVNSHLVKSKEKYYIEDLFTDLQDGKALLKLLEIISGEKMPPITKGKLRIHCIENVTKSITFLNEQHVYLENLGAHDIVDGNPTLILGLIWTIILRFQIQNATTIDQQDGPRKTSKDSLLLWCQMKTAGYQNVNIRNFTTSWKDGLAFNALLHKHRPEVVDYVSLTKASPTENLNSAFQLAEREFGVPQLLDSKDMTVDQPDEKSVMTYIGTLCLALNRMKSTLKHTKRLGNVIEQALQVDQAIHQYEFMANQILAWIAAKIHWMENTELVESLPGVKKQLTEFSRYRLVEKPPRFEERGQLEIKFFEIQSKLRADNRRLYIAPEGRLVSDINRAWETLETSEHRMELRLHEALIRQEKLEQLGNHFARKSQMRETWLAENDSLVRQSALMVGDLVSVVAAIKKHDALEGDILAHEKRIEALMNIAENLRVENYYRIGEIDTRLDTIVAMWQRLLADLEKRRARLDRCRDVELVLAESDYVLDWMGEVAARLRSKDFGKHLLGVEDLIEKHKILSRDVKALESRVAETVNRLERFSNDDSHQDEEPDRIKRAEKVHELETTYEKLQSLLDERNEQLLRYRTMWSHVADLENTAESAKEILQLLQNPDLGHDLSSVERLIRKHEQLSGVVETRRDQTEQEISAIQSEYKHDIVDRREIISLEINDLREILEQLDRQLARRQKDLQASLAFQQLLADIDDVDAQIGEERRWFEKSAELGDKLSMCEFYERQHDERMLAIDELDRAMLDLEDRGRLVETDPNNELDKALANTRHNYRLLLELVEARRVALEKNRGKFELVDELDSIESWIVAKEKLLVTLIASEEFDELNVIQHRFDGFEAEMKNYAGKIEAANAVGVRLLAGDHPEHRQISGAINRLNEHWNRLADLAESKKHELRLAMEYEQFLLECHEIRTVWISEKMRLLEWTDDIKDDLDGIMQLQRRLGSLQRDVQAIQAKVLYLNGQAKMLARARPADEARIDAEIAAVNELWEELKIMLQDRDDRLNSSTELQQFFKDLDAFDLWLKKIQIQVATLDIPQDLQEAEKFYANHQDVHTEISIWEPEFVRLLQFGRQVSRSKDDPQYLLFNERLNVLEKEWNLVHRMWADKELSLRQSREAQTFNRDALQVDGILAKQESFLAKTDIPTSYEAAEIADRAFETFKSSVATNQPKIDGVLQFGSTLLATNALADKIRLKCDQIRERCKSIQLKLDLRGNSLKDQIELQMYNEDVMDLEEWIAEKMMIASDTSFHDAKDISTRYNRFRDFERELEANRDRVNEVIQAGNKLIKEKPHFEKEIEPKIEHLEYQWNELLESAKEKSIQMEEANREIIFDESTKSMMSWVTEISSQIITTEEITEEYGLVEINEKLKDQGEKDKQLEQKMKMLMDMDQHATKLKEQYPDRKDEFEEVQKSVRVQLTQIEMPMAERRGKLTLQFRVQQFLRDFEDEKKWIEEKIRFITNFRQSPDSLQVCLQRIRRLKTMATEIENHMPRIDQVNNDAQELIQDGHPASERFSAILDELNGLWNELISVCEECEQFFEDSREVQQYLFDAAEAEYWMSEREFDLMREDKAKDEGGALNAMRKHEELIGIINNYGSVVSELGERYHSILGRDLPDSHLVAQKQERVDKMYATLLEMCLEKKLKIEDLIQFFHLYRSIQGLEEWIEERRIVATSNEVGSELEHCFLLRERFREFANETNELGKPRVAEADEMCDRLIGLGHQDSAEIAQWKDRINEAWADLLELIETRIQLLKAAYDFFKFMSDSSELLDLILEKMILIPEGVAKDARTVAASQRKHHAFVTEVEHIELLIVQAVETADHLLPLYCGEKEIELIDRKNELQRLWYLLQRKCDDRKNVLMDAADLYKFYAMVRELVGWMAGIDIQINADDRARDVCGVELIISNHRSLKAEIDSRDENRTICLTLGRTLINRHHPQRNDVRHKCAEVVTRYFNILENWRERQEFIEMVLEVYQFAREAAVAEAWLIAQELQLNSNEFGDTLNETMLLLQKHLVLERNLAVQDERFEALKKLTSFEEARNALTEDKKREKALDRQRRLDVVLVEFRTPPPSPELVRKADSKQPPVDGDVIVATRAEHAQSAAPVPSPREQKEISPKSVSALIEPSQAPLVPKSGTLSRKHEWESATKKSGNRKWYELFVVVELDQMAFYKDRRHWEEDAAKKSLTTAQPQHTYKHEKPLVLAGAVSSPAIKYKKRPNVFRMRLDNGAEYLFEAPTDADMTDWVDRINAVGRVDSSPTHYATLPNMKTSAEPETGAAAAPVPAEKRKFPTLGRKQKS